MLVEALHPTESVEYMGRAVVALAYDPYVSQKSGQLLEVGALAESYGYRWKTYASFPRTVSPMNHLQFKLGGWIRQL
ncbi:hypothetical protein BC351_11330 [Paenibacillus ferrarius]|uniref:Uncharacterized protein n=1 Tax=Paenibacillus ferrarius TaxID=1469647 RepID=A0A1V4H7W8_9BACL|nr:hypothetical protein BC351_11330 [Paenibacillus ferrarius]